MGLPAGVIIVNAGSSVADVIRVFKKHYIKCSTLYIWDANPSSYWAIKIKSHVSYLMRLMTGVFPLVFSGGIQT